MKPTHRLKVMDKTTGYKTTLAAGWQNEDGTLTLAFNPCVVVKPDRNLIYTLFPQDNTDTLEP